MKTWDGARQPDSALESGGRHAPPLWFRRLTRAANVPVLLALLFLALLVAYPTSWSLHPLGIRRMLNLVFGTLCPILASSFLAVRFVGGGGTHWLLLGMGALSYGAAGFVDATPLPGDPLDTGITVRAASYILCGILSLLASPFAGRPPLQHVMRRPKAALMVGYVGVLSLVTLITWAKLSGHLPVFFFEETGSTMARQTVLSMAVLVLVAAASFLYLAALRQHPYALRWYALGLALLAIGAWGQANIEDIWGLLAWANRGVLSLAALYLLTGSILATREPHAGATVPLAALLQSERQFRAFFENAGVGTAQIGLDHGFIRVNDRFCEITGYSPEELLTMTPYKLDHPDERDADQVRLSRLFAEPEYRYDVEKRYVRKEGRIIWVHVTIVMVRDAEGHPIQTAAIIEDITERVTEQRRASRYTRVIAAINRILSETVRAETEEALGRVCLAVALDITDSRVGCVAELSHPGVRDIAFAGTDWGGCGMPAGTPYGAFCERAIRERRTLIASLPAYPISGEEVSLEDPPLASFLGVPLIQDGIATGILVVGHREGDYLREQQEDLEELAPTVAQALQKKRDEQALRQHTEDLEVLDRTNQALLREINHRVKNNLSAILGLIQAERRRLRADPVPRCEVLLDDLAERVHSLASVHMLLSASGWRPLQLTELVEDVISAAVRIAVDVQRFTLQVTPSPVRVTPTQAHHLALVLGELAMNTLKHGHSTQQIRIDVRIGLKEGQVWLGYRDYGPGYPATVLTGVDRSVGMGLLDTIVRMSLRGTWNIRNDQGAVTEVGFPYEAENGDDIDES